MVSWRSPKPLVQVRILAALLMSKITVIIPCYNEEMWVGQAIRLLLFCPAVNEIIAVNDGSKDKTLEVLNKFSDKIKIISYKKNQGKGYAMAEGIKAAQGDIIVFMDAHHLNIKDGHIQAITLPLVKNRADAVLGTTISFSIDPFWRLTGFRAYRRQDLLPLLSELAKTRFGAEVYLNEVFKDKRRKVVKFKDLVHMIKQQIMAPSKMLNGYLIEALEVSQTLAKLNGLDPEKFTQIFDPRKIKSVKTLKAVIRKIKNRRLVFLLRKYILSYLTIS